MFRLGKDKADVYPEVAKIFYQYQSRKPDRQEGIGF